MAAKGPMCGSCGSTGHDIAEGAGVVHLAAPLEGYIKVSAGQFCGSCRRRAAAKIHWAAGAGKLRV